MVTADEALRLILANTPTLGTENVSLLRSLGRVVASDIMAEEDLPPFDNSSMDGYAIISGDMSRGPGGTSPELEVIGEASAGKVFRSEVKSGQAVRVMTGGKLPRGADAVVPIESVTLVSEARIVVGQTIATGQYVRRMGEDIRRAEVVVRLGERIGPGHMGVLASLGCTKVSVFKTPRVNILATGNELAEVHKKLGEGQIRNSNSVALDGYVRESGGKPRMLGIVPDRKTRIRQAIKKAPAADALLITGGVSVGAYDFVKDVLQELGVQLIVRSISIKPGRPLVFGSWKNMIVFGLPGNPVSTSVTFLQFVHPALRKLSGQPYNPPQRYRAVMEGAFDKRDGKRHFVRGIAKQVDGTFHVHTTGTQSSGAMSSMIKANCFIILPESVTSVKSGDWVEIELL